MVDVTYLAAPGRLVNGCYCADMTRGPVRRLTLMAKRLPQGIGRRKRSHRSAQVGVGLTGLVYGLTIVSSVGNVALCRKPLFWAAVVTIIFIALNIIFW